MVKFTELFCRPKLWRLIGALIFIGGLFFFASQVVWAAETSQYLIRQLAELGDRSTGTPGCSKAADQIEQAFRSLGIERVGRQRFLVPVTQYQPAHLTLKGQSIPIRPLRLNALSPQATPAPAIEGSLYYVGQGQLQDFNSINVSGSIILMELDSGKNWLNAAMLGARALIYLDRGPTPKWFFRDKRELTSLEFPRFWLPVSQARALFGSFEKAPNGLVASRVSLSCSGGWRRVQGENIYALIEGKSPELKDQLLVVEAFYDSTALVPDMSPGADEASSIFTLLNLARSLIDNPPGRSVLLVATSGHAQTLAGMREFIWPLRSTRRERKKLDKELKDRLKGASEALEVLKEPVVLEQSRAERAERLRETLADQIKSEVDSLSQRLIQLRLDEGEQRNQGLIDELARRRLLLRRLGWRKSYLGIEGEELKLLKELIPAAIEQNQTILKDAQEQMKCWRSAARLRELMSDFELTTIISLHLSSHGSGVGAFNYGFMYDLKPQINRTAIYAPINRILNHLSQKVEKELGLTNLFQDTLRPSPLRPWQSYLPDRPALGGEVSALAGFMGLTLATLNDARPFWGTPYDQPGTLNLAYLEQQSRLVSGLIQKLTHEPEMVYDRLPLRGFSSLLGRANFIRQGELFPDQPAPGTLVLIYQGPSLFYSMVDTGGSFSVQGLADRKHTIHKAILEGFRFSLNSGQIIWAIDKAMTGKDAYRIKMTRRLMETDLVMFACRSTTLFDLLEPRTFSYLTKINLIDAMTEAKPVRYWWSRIDTGASTLADIFLEPITPFKLTLSDTVLEKKLVLLNSDASNPEGKGYRVERWPIIPATEYRVAKDMWDLLLPRIANLENHGIKNDQIRALQKEGIQALEGAEDALENLRYDRFMEDSRTSWALASRIYNDIEKTQKDVLFGVLFYIALFVPFAYCLERLLFSFVDIHKRIIAFLMILGLIIAVIYLVHPAFRLTYSPLVVILAFFILGLSLLVALIIIGRFEQEMELLQQRARKIRGSEISRTKAFVAAFVLGVSNLRRRPLRTLLTCVTLIILTFTIMSFTTVKTLRHRGRLRLEQGSPYKGLLMKILNWDSLPPEALAMTRNKFNDQALVVPRVWLENEDRTQPPVVSIRLGGKEILVQGVMGLSAQEPRVSKIESILSCGRWFRPDERNAVLLPERVAKSLGISPKDPEKSKVSIWGTDFQVVGCFRGEGLESHLDLDGESLTPAIFPSEAVMEVSEVEMEAIEAGEQVQVFQSRYQHIPGDLVVIMPFQTLMALGGKLKALAIRPQYPEDTSDLARTLVDRFGLTLFAGEKDGTFMYYASDALSYSGVPNILIPLLISVLIVLNTMIGSVYERKREIAVYTSVGLAPNHVSFLFIAEALAFAVLSVVLGYLVAQTSAEVFAGTSLWQGITVNYSSLAGVAAMMLVILVVLVSVIYPSRVAASIAIPDVTRTWTLPESDGNEMKLTLPFLMKHKEQLGIGGYLREYYFAHKDVSHGLFTTDDISLEFYCPIKQLSGLAGPDHCEKDCIQLKTRVWLAPFDFGVKQLVYLVFCASAEDPDSYLEIQVNLQREAGEANSWRRINKAFINDLRKQLLIWRSLDNEAQAHYANLLATEQPF
jgi:hypothetical protein